jgi:hypothetical protein
MLEKDSRFAKIDSQFAKRESIYVLCPVFARRFARMGFEDTEEGFLIL